MTIEPLLLIHELFFSTTLMPIYLNPRLLYAITEVLLLHQIGILLRLFSVCSLARRIMHNWSRSQDTNTCEGAIACFIAFSE